MPDTTLSTPQIIDLAPVLAAVLPITPLDPKPRYALQRWGTAVEKPFQAYAKAENEIVVACEVPGSRKIVGNQAAFEVQPELQEDFNRDIAALKEPMVTLSGVRQITHAEIKGWPISAAHEKVLIACGVLDDVEPA